jgi:hypothetical protein
MRQAVWAFLLAPAVFFAGACLQDNVQGGGDDVAGKAEPADNSFCHVCHMNYKKESVAVRHAKAGIGCAQCHGESDDHSSDEDGITPPQIMYAKQKINPACMKCHPESKVRRESEHRPVLAKLATHEAVCTDCHGKHRLTVRTRRWDKDTGKLIADDGVRMTREMPAKQ